MNSSSSVGGPCTRCRCPGRQLPGLRLEYAEAPAGGWPPGVPAARLAEACRGCGSDFLSVTPRLSVTPEGELAEVPWVICQHCGLEAAALWWPWTACDLCGAERRDEPA